MPNSSIKDESLYEDLRKQGNSKEKAARISNAAAAKGRSSVGEQGRQVRRVRRLDRLRAQEKGERAWCIRLFG
jgi:hypothetical protein